MIDRVYVKSQVKELMRGRWGKLFLGLLLVSLVSLIPNVIIQSMNGSYNYLYYNIMLNGANWNYDTLLMQMGPMLTIIWLVPLAFSIFVSLPLQTSTAGMFLRFLRNENPPATSVFDAFRYYGSALSSMLWQSLFIFLWSLLFVIPGIVKSYSYSMVPYIVAENPHIGFRKALQLSMRMTDGYKGQLFVLDLSFFGWMFLANFTLGILYVWLAPYMQTSRAAYYEELKQRALQSGRLTARDFQPE